MYFSLSRAEQGIVNFDAKISDSALHLRMTQQKLYGTKVSDRRGGGQ
jgi:hypothetical protein